MNSFARVLRAALPFAALLVPVSPGLRAEAMNWATALSLLARSDGALPSVDVPTDAIAHQAGTPAWNVERAMLLLAAADTAAHNQFTVRSAQLAAEAEKGLAKAVQQGLSGKDASEADCLLGLLAERRHNDLAAAARFYQQALSADTNNQQASRALARVQLRQNRHSKGQAQ